MLLNTIRVYFRSDIYGPQMSTTVGRGWCHWDFFVAQVHPVKSPTILAVQSAYICMYDKGSFNSLLTGNLSPY